MILEIAEQMDTRITETETVIAIETNEVVIDIRAPEEEEHKPLNIEGVEVKRIPFLN